MSYIQFVRSEEISSDIESDTICPIKLLKWCLINEVNRIHSFNSVWQLGKGKNAEKTTNIEEVISFQKYAKQETTFIGWEIDTN